MKKFKWSLMTMLLSLFMVCIVPESAHAATWNKKDAQTVTKGAFTYEAYMSENGKQCWIYNVKIDKSKNTETLRFPKKIAGAKVTQIGNAHIAPNKDEYYNIFGEYVEWFHSGDGYGKSMKGIKKVVIPDSVEKINSYAFAGLRNVTTVKLPKNLKKLEERTFYRCKKLTKITIPQKTKQVSVTAFEKCKSLDTITVSKKNKKYAAKDGMLLSSNMNTLYYVMPGKETIVIPETVTAIEKDALNAPKVSTIEIDAKNTTFTKDEQCIYNMNTKELVAVINTGDTLTISDKVEVITSDVVIIGKQAKNINIPASVKKLGKEWHKICKYNAVIRFESTTPPYIESDVSGEVYARIPWDATIMVPSAGKSAYTAWVKEHESECSIIGY